VTAIQRMPDNRLANVPRGSQNEYFLHAVFPDCFPTGVYNKGSVKAPYPVGLLGDGITRSITLAMPSSLVRTFLPPHLQLCPQDVTPPETHPVTLLFHSFIHGQFSFPTLLRPMDFCEQNIGIPFTCVSPSYGVSGGLGPYYFMPRLYLNNAWVLMVGRYMWGFNKIFAEIDIAANRFTVSRPPGRRLVSLEWSYSDHEPLPAIGGYPEFDSVRSMLSQPLISLSPAGIGPMLTVTDFDRTWNLATVRPLRAELEIGPGYLPGLEPGRYLSRGRAADGPVLGTFETSGQWWFSFPYPLAGAMLSAPAGTPRWVR
jgi:hypothetical protein